MTEKTVSDHLSETKMRTQEVPFETPGYISWIDWDDDEGYVEVRGTLPSEQTKFKHRFDNPDDWSYKWALVRLIESDDYSWSVGTFDNDNAVGEAVPLERTSSGYKIKVPERKEPRKERIRQRARRYTRHITPSNVLAMFWITCLIILLVAAVVVIL